MDILVFKGWRWLSPKGEVTEGVRAGEVRRVAPFQQGEDVVDHFAESHIPRRRRDCITAWTRGTPASSPRCTWESGGIHEPMEGSMQLTQGRLF